MLPSIDPVKASSRDLRRSVDRLRAMKDFAEVEGLQKAVQLMVEAHSNLPKDRIEREIY